MDVYKFRVLRGAAGNSSEDVECRLNCDCAAILYAWKQFSQMQGIEIWRGTDLVYARYQLRRQKAPTAK
jgi:hypothetical protein